MTVQEKTRESLIGKTIVSADVDGYGIELTFDDGNTFLYSPSDGGYSTWDFSDWTDEDWESFEETEC